MVDNPPKRFLGAEGMGSLHELLHGVDAAPETPVVADPVSSEPVQLVDAKTLAGVLGSNGLQRLKDKLAKDGVVPDIPESLDKDKLPKRQTKRTPDKGAPPHA